MSRFKSMDWKGVYKLICLWFLASWKVCDLLNELFQNSLLVNIKLLTIFFYLTRQPLFLLFGKVICIRVALHLKVKNEVKNLLLGKGLYITMTNGDFHPVIINIDREPMKNYYPEIHTTINVIKTRRSLLVFFIRPLFS